MSGPTPGPWLVSDFDWTTVYVRMEGNQPGIASTAGEPIALLPVEQQRANARLIAAAPELLVALESMLLLHDCGASMAGNVSDVIESARAAIAKATGGQP